MLRGGLVFFCADLKGQGGKACQDGLKVGGSQELLVVDILEIQ